MHIALTGSSGFIGSFIAKKAHEHGHSITALVRESSRRDHIESYISKFVVGTHDDKSAVNQLLDDADVVIHKSGNLDSHIKSNLQGSIDLLEASEQRQFIYISSIAVHRHMHPNWNGSIEESHPTRPGSLYGACKASLEAHLWAANASRNQTVTAMRPCAVYGIDPNIKRSIGWPIIEQLKANKPYTMIGGGKFVHVEDVAEATISAIQNPLASPAVYNLVDCYARWADWATIIADELGIDAEIDLSSPPQPTNSFDIANVNNDLGVMLNRGFSGIREEAQKLIKDF
jgi:dTDP-glucose 4,6-dehydratase